MVQHFIIFVKFATGQRRSQGYNFKTVLEQGQFWVTQLVVIRNMLIVTYNG